MKLEHIASQLEAILSTEFEILHCSDCPSCLCSPFIIHKLLLPCLFLKLTRSATWQGLQDQLGRMHCLWLRDEEFRSKRALSMYAIVPVFSSIPSNLTCLQAASTKSLDYARLMQNILILVKAELQPLLCRSLMHRDSMAECQGRSMSLSTPTTRLRADTCMRFMGHRKSRCPTSRRRTQNVT